MTKFFSFTLMAVLCVGITSCLFGRERVKIKDVGPYVTLPIEYVDAFSTIDAKGIADVEFTQTEGKPSITISGSENVIPYLTVEVRRGVLEISMKADLDIRDDYRLTVAVAGNELSLINTRGTGNVTVLGEFDTDEFEANTSGTGDLEFASNIIASGSVVVNTKGTGDVLFGKLEAADNDVSIAVSGTGNLTFNEIVSTGDIAFRVSGTGDISGRSVGCFSSEIIASGTSDVEINELQSERIELSVSGTGDAYLGCRADNMQVRVSGTGDVELAGSCGYLEASLSGVAVIDAERLIADSVVAKASGGGTISCHAVNELNATVSGLGKIIYSGDPQVTVGGNTNIIHAE